MARLTEAGRGSRRGALLLHGWWGRPALRSLRVTFDLLAHGGGALGGAGVSFNYGPLDEDTALDESGGEHAGLAVALVRGATAVLEVRLRGALILSRPLGDAWPRRVWAPGEPLPDTATIRIDHFLANVRPSFPRWLGGKPQELDALLKQVEGAV